MKKSSGVKNFSFNAFAISLSESEKSFLRPAASPT